jgi:hypothetical protein
LVWRISFFINFRTARSRPLTSGNSFPNLSQILPRIDSRPMPIFPGRLYRVAPHRLHPPQSKTFRRPLRLHSRNWPSQSRFPTTSRTRAMSSKFFQRKIILRPVLPSDSQLGTNHLQICGRLQTDLTG